MRLLNVLLLAFASDGLAQSYREQRLTAELEQDPHNIPKILELAALKLDDTSGIINESDRAARLDEVQGLYLRANNLDSRNVDALFHIGVISWMKVFPAVVTARREAAMEPETPGPVRDRSSRAVLNARYRADVEYAIACLEQTIALDPSNNSAMAYLQMAYRARADFKDTRAQWDDDQTAAGQWREKAYEVGMANLATEPPLRLGSRLSKPCFTSFLPGSNQTASDEIEKKRLHSPLAVCPSELPSAGEPPREP